MNKKNKSLLPLDVLLSAVAGKYIGSKETAENFYFSNVVTDSRQVKENSLFVPLVGEFQDGHKYVEQAIEKGASVIFINNSEYVQNKSKYEDLVYECKNISFIVVSNTLYALQYAATAYVELFPNLIKVAITGSSGKTTTKEIVVSVLKEKYNVIATQGNFNSETGLPLSVFNIRKEHQVGVFEMGMNRTNEIKEISSVLKANYAIITNIGTAHIGILGSKQNIATEKKHAFDYVSKSGAVFIPFNDEYADFLKKDVIGKTVFYGESVDKNISGISNYVDCGLNGSSFILNKTKINLSIPGVYNFRNALSAVMLAKELGLTDEEIKRGIENLSNINGRMEKVNLTVKGNVNINLIKDCYNANFESMTSAISFCNELNNVNQKILVLGDMLELGEKSKEIHEQIGKIISENKFDYVIFIGEQMEYAAKSAKQNGAKNTLCIPFGDDDAMLFASQFIVDCVSEGDLVLLKASRGLSLERIIPLISQDVHNEVLHG